MKKHILQTLFALLLLSLILLILLPYFQTHFMEIRQKEENEINYRRLLKEEQAKKESEKIAAEKNYLTGKFDPAERKDFVLIPPQYASNNASQNKMYLRKEAYEAYLAMQTAADRDEVDLKIASATRNFEYQKELWNKKWTGETIVDGKNLSLSVPDGLERFKKILEYSAVPGTSRHHWGTDIDINGATPEYFKEGKGEKEYEWLDENAPLFGFCQTYSEKGPERLTGYNEEKWHWSYLPLAKVFTKEYEDLIGDDDIKGFDGDEFVPGQDLINNYVLGINPDCI